MKKKIAILALAFVLVFALGIGGTLAWLTDSTSEVKNTFTVGDVNITLNESKIGDDGKALTGDKAEKVTSNDAYQLVPGYTYCKDPTVTVSAGSVDCYLFVKFEESNVKSSDGSVSYLTYTSNLKVPDWTQGTGTNKGDDGIPQNVWYRKVTSSEENQSWLLLAELNEEGETNSGIHVKVPTTLTKADIEKLKDNDGNFQTPTLTYTAYACQLYKTNKPGDGATDKQKAAAQFTAADAWKEINSEDAYSGGLTE